MALPEKIELREGRVGDGAAVAIVFGAARAPMRYLPVLHTPAENEAFFAEVVETHDVTLAVTGAGAGAVPPSHPEVVGFSAVHGGWLHHLYVVPGWQGARIGGALLERAMAAHAGGLSLWVFARNGRAVALYGRSGFAVVERTDGRGNEEGQPDVRMVWPGAPGWTVPPPPNSLTGQ